MKRRENLLTVLFLAAFALGTALMCHSANNKLDRDTKERQNEIEK